ncbi:MAG TPA: hypothetical protein VMY34_00245, partial [Acidimicrobiales bacterium]|nr:hypothetical protein [Acidimicrobiales bacterium]
RPTTIAALEASARFTRVTPDSPLDSTGGVDPFTVLEVVGPADQPSPASLVTFSPIGGEAELVDTAPDRYVLDVTPELAGRVEIAVAWSPRWRATLDGRGVSLEATDDGLMRLRVGPGTHRIDLHHQPTLADHSGAAISLATLIAVGVPVAHRRLRLRRRRSRSQSGPA